MFKFLRSKNKTKTPEAASPASDNLSKGLTRTRHKLTDGLASLILGKKSVDAALLDAIETLLLTSDVGVEATQSIIADLTDKLARKQLNDPQAVFDCLRQDLEQLLTLVEQPLTLPASHSPYVILMVGVNGAGKTTTIGKLAARLQAEGKSVLLAAGDTFRAAAVEQLKAWGKAHDVPVIAQQRGADSASVSFDALQAAQARGIDVVIVDTAGRLHTKDNLLEELKKIKRVLAKLDATSPHEIMLVLDATTGQNGLRQAQVFYDTIGVTGITLTKLDGTAKGGVIFGMAKTLGLPIRFIGVGESTEDLRVFSAADFVNALFE